MKKAVVLVSGGMDSLVTLAIAHRDYEVFPLHVRYGNKTQKSEGDCFYFIVTFYKLNKPMLVDMPFLGRMGGSSLTDKKIETEKGAPVKNEIPSSYVPFRNTHLLSAGVSYAEVCGAEAIFLGAVEQDSSGYPDCSKEYIEQFNGLIKVGSRAGGKIKVITPLIDLSKKEIVQKGVELGVPFEKSWSCYVSNEIACGECQSCNLRLKAFREAGIKDPIKYRKE